jgi:hypothetical protein
MKTKITAHSYLIRVIYDLARFIIKACSSRIGLVKCAGTGFGGDYGAGSLALLIYVAAFLPLAAFNQSNVRIAHRILNLPIYV